MVHPLVSVEELGNYIIYQSVSILYKALKSFDQNRICAMEIIDYTKKLLIKIYYNSVLYTVPPTCSEVVFGSYSLLSTLCVEDFRDSVAMDESSEKMLSSMVHNLWSGGSLRGEF